MTEQFIVQHKITRLFISLGFYADHPFYQYVEDIQTKK